MKCKNCGVSFDPSRRQIREVAINNNRLVFCNISCYREYQSKGLIINPGKFKKGQNTGCSNVNWKGDAVGYYAVHDWIIREYGQLQICEHCDAVNLGSRKHQWANISGEYKRDRSDWLRLCAKCHYKYDGRDKNFDKYHNLKIRTKMSNNKCGFKNVRVTKYNKYRSYITVSGKQINLGSYETPQAAYQIYKEKALELYNDF